MISTGPSHLPKSESSPGFSLLSPAGMPRVFYFPIKVKEVICKKKKKKSIKLEKKFYINILCFPLSKLNGKKNGNCED